MNTIKMTCINCPLGCSLDVKIQGDNIDVSGNRCARGLEYAVNEIKSPKRTITSTLRVIDGDKPMISVKTSSEIPKERIFDIIRTINLKTVCPPIRIGDVVIKDILGLGADIIATSNADIKKAMD